MTLKVKVIYWFSSRFYQICIIQIFSTICISESLCLKFKVVKLFMQKTIFVEVMWAKIYNNCINSTTNYEFICSINEKALLTYHFRVEKYWLFFCSLKQQHFIFIPGCHRRSSKDFSQFLDTQIVLIFFLHRQLLSYFPIVLISTVIRLRGNLLFS